MAKAVRAWRTYREVSKTGSPGLWARVRAIPRMLGAGMRGEYAGMGKSKLVLLAASVVYIVSPIDIIPDFLLVIGVADDFGVFLWMLGTLLGESGRYVELERKTVRGVIE